MTATPLPLTLGAILYEGFELLDLFGPLEMFGNLRPRVKIAMVAQNAGPVASFQGPKILAESGFEDCPDLDLILLPGGVGAFREMNNSDMINFLKARVPHSKRTMTVCSGSWVLAKTGLLDGRKATSNKIFFDIAQSQSGKVLWVEKARWVEDGPFVTSSGVSAGTDMALAVIATLFGEQSAQQVAIATEYQWHREATTDPFHRYLNQYEPALVEQLKAAVGG
jgi:transcriptional regulator GlxA family with amidase domain